MFSMINLNARMIKKAFGAVRQLAALRLLPAENDAVPQ